MAADLQVDQELLHRLAEELVAIRDVINESSTAAQFDPAALGNGRVAEALHDVTHNWHRKREILTNNIEAVAGMAERSHEIFKGADEELAKKARAILQGR